MNISQRIEEYMVQKFHVFAVKHEWRFRIVERSLARLVERKSLRALDWIMPPWRRGKVLTRYVEPDTQPRKDVH